MTTYETISILISIAGSVGVIASLWLLSRQTRVFNRQLLEGISQSMMGYSLEISRLFLEHPDLRPYFFSGKTIHESHPDYLQAEAVAEVMLDIFWTMMSQARRIQDDEYTNEETRAQWALYIGDCFASSPLLTSFLIKRKDWYGNDMMRYLEQGLARARQQVS